MPVMHAFIDEAGVRARTLSSSEHFVMSAVVVKDPRLAEAESMVAQLRADLGRRPGDTLHWQNFKQHAQRLHAAKTIGQAPFLKVCSVVVCKRHLEGRQLNDDQAYLYTFRFLLERLSWLAKEHGYELRYTLAHIVRFKLSTLRQYEEILRGTPEPACRIAWTHVDPKGGTLDQPKRVELLQLADSAASATYAAFEPDQFGNTETRYLKEMASRLWRRGAGANRLTSYGLKLHPHTDITKAAYPWVAAL